MSSTAIFSAPAAETKCDATQSLHTPCTVVLGGSVYIQVMTNASGLTVWCKKVQHSGYATVFGLKKEEVSIEKEFKNRTQFFINNGTLKITNVEKSDSGQYLLEVFGGLNGILVRNNTVQLDVQGKY